MILLKTFMVGSLLHDESASHALPLLTLLRIQDIVNAVSYELLYYCTNKVMLLCKQLCGRQLLT